MTSQTILDLRPPAEPKPPKGHVGNVLRRLQRTMASAPITPLDLARDPDLYGTDYMRNLRYVRQWLEDNTEWTVACEKARKDKAHWKYWLAIRGK